MKRIIFLLLLINYSHAQETCTENSEKFVNSNCEKSDSCDLLGFEFKVTRITSKEVNGMTSSSYLEGFYETKSVDSLEKYATVQYIRGGLYDINQMGDEPSYKTISHTREFFGHDLVPFQHDDWVIDSLDDDPIYASAAQKNHRHGYYMIKKDENSSILFDGAATYLDYYFYNPKIKIPRMHFTDMPTGGRYSEIMIAAGENKDKLLKYSTNSTMEFVICIFKTKDIPRYVDHYYLDQSKAIGCLSWHNYHIFDALVMEFKDHL